MDNIKIIPKLNTLKSDIYLKYNQMNILINPILTLKKLHSTICEILIDDVFFAMV